MKENNPKRWYVFSVFLGSEYVRSGCEFVGHSNEFGFDHRAAQSHEAVQAPTETAERMLVKSNRLCFFKKKE